ncbi:Pkinase domain-containing protein [Cephalotus follicularis]|uniref:Pkinase domain-containing protein n=1 Tax=Cephalotus follicularis TaxID=3775 RepID=A0A1Q3AZF3_CEPFO|nr:Pkinase domain-containing protein [Cephalotus follicularis]
MKLELAPEGTIRDLIKKRPGKIPEFEVRHYTHMILQGLQTIHQSGIVHCDLCPQNILLFPRGRFLSRVKIANFGRAKLSGQKYCRNRRLCYRGNVWYMSPESMKVVAENGAVDMIRKPLDIWSLGCTVVEMISGRKAWQLADTDVLMYDFFDEDDLPTLPETLSKKGRDFFRMCFVRDPDKRATASELLCHPFVSEISLPDREEEASLTIGEYAAPFSLPPLGRCFYNLGLDQWRKLHSDSDPLQ